VEKKKEQAADAVQTRVASGYKGNNKSAAEAKDLLAKGDIQGLMRGWGTYGSMFARKK
jgi:hypothetical protein